MTSNVINNIVRFVVLILMQALIVQNIHLGSYIILLPYVLIILLFPFDMPKLMLLGFAFLVGLTIVTYFTIRPGCMRPHVH
jgi:hypothetical protein